MNNYLKVTYGSKPYTDYPYKLAKYLTEKFSLISGQTLLDLGCGRGEFSDGFRKIGFKVEGLDKNILENVLNNKITVADFEKKLPYQNDTFKIIFCKSVIEHTSHPEHIFKEAHRILKPYGKFILMTPDWESVYQKFYCDFTHKTPFTLESLRNIFRMFDFNAIHCEKFRQLPFLWGKKYFNLEEILNIKKTIKFWKEQMLLGIGMK